MTYVFTSLTEATSDLLLAPPSSSGIVSSQSATACGLSGGFNSTHPATSVSGGMATTAFSGEQKQSTGLFGASATTNAQPSTGSGLLGSGNTASQQSSASGGLFGSNANNQQQQPPTSGSLFGGASNTQPQQSQPSLSGGLFGGVASNQPQQQQPQQQQPQQQQPQQHQTGGINGQAIIQQQPAQSQSTGGSFGASAANNQPAAAGGLFGLSQAKPSGGLFGQAQTQLQQPYLSTQIPAVQINYDNLRPRTRFDDLAQPVQDEIALIDKGIQRIIKMRDEIGEFMPRHARDIEQLGRDVKFVESKFRTVQVAHNRDIQTVKVLQSMTKKNIADAQLSFKATDNLKLPTHYHQTGLFSGTLPSTDSTATDASSPHASAQDLITYFNGVCDDMEKYKKRLDDYRDGIERDMPGVENGLYEQIRTFRDRDTSGSGAVHDQLNQVLSALRETGNAIVAQAGQIADTRERLSRLQAGILDSGLYAIGMAT